LIGAFSMLSRQTCTYIWIKIYSPLAVSEHSECNVIVAGKALVEFIKGYLIGMRLGGIKHKVSVSN